MQEEMTPEEMILEDMIEWLEVKILDTGFYDHLDEIEHKQGKQARSDRLSYLTDKYWREHIVH
jgi:hypothetical protein